MLFNQNQMGRMIGQYMWSQGRQATNPRVEIVDIETREVGTFTAVNNLATSTGFPTTGNGNCFRFNPNGTTLAVAYSASPYIFFFNKVGNAYTKLPDLATADLPNKGCAGISWHPSGKYIASVFDPNNNLGQCVVYERTGDTFTTITNTASFTAAITATIGMTKCSWSPQGDVLCMTMSSAPYFLAYTFNESTKTFTKIVNPLEGNHPNNRCEDVAWNNSGTSIAIGGGPSTTRKLAIFNRNSTGTFTKISVDPTQPPSNVYGVAWGGTNSEYLVCNGTLSPYIHFYLRSGDTFMKAANPATVPAGPDGYGLDCSSDGRFVVSAHFNGNTTYFRRDPATTSTWVNMGAMTSTVSSARYPTIYPNFTR